MFLNYKNLSRFISGNWYYNNNINLKVGNFLNVRIHYFIITLLHKRA